MSQEATSEEVTETEVTFKEHHKLVKKGHDDLIKLIETLYNSPNGKVEADDGSFITKKQLGSYKAAFTKDYNLLLSLHNKTTKKTKPKTSNKGKNNRNPMFVPMFVNKKIVDYFSEVDLGPAYKMVNGAEVEQNEDAQWEFEEYNKKLRDCLDTFLKKRITSCASLTPLFILVTRRLKLQDPENKQFVIPDARFKKFFGDIFEKVAREQVVRIKELKGKVEAKTIEPSEKEELKKLEKNPLDPNKFRLVRFQTIVSYCREKTLTDQQREVLKDKDIIAKIEEEQKIISDTLKYSKSSE